MLKVKFDDIRPSGVYIRVNNDNPEFTTEYFDTKDNGVVQINRDENGDICSVIVIDGSRSVDE